MISLRERRRWASLFGTPLKPEPLSEYGRIMQRQEGLEAMQLQLEEADCRERVRRAESRAIRRYIASQPKPAVNLDGVLQAPGQPAWECNDGRMVGGLPRRFTNDWTNRFEARRA